MEPLWRMVCAGLTVIRGRQEDQHDASTRRPCQRQLDVRVVGVGAQHVDSGGADWASDNGYLWRVARRMEALKYVAQDERGQAPSRRAQRWRATRQRQIWERDEKRWASQLRSDMGLEPELSRDCTALGARMGASMGERTMADDRTYVALGLGLEPVALLLAV